MDIRIILVRPRNPDNIGAAARAMANFGLGDLALVGAFASDWGEAEKTWRAEASVSAIKAMGVIDAARLHAAIPEAAAGCDLLLGTSSLHYLNPERDVLLLRDAARYCADRGAGKLAPENTAAAFRLGQRLGWRMAECDVKLSGDGVPFLLHDDRLERTTSGRGTAA